MKKYFIFYFVLFYYIVQALELILAQKINPKGYFGLIEVILFILLLGNLITVRLLTQFLTAIVVCLTNMVLVNLIAYKLFSTNIVAFEFMAIIQVVFLMAFEYFGIKKQSNFTELFFVLLLIINAIIKLYKYFFLHSELLSVIYSYIIEMIIMFFIVKLLKYAVTMLLKANVHNNILEIFTLIKQNELLDLRNKH